MGFDGRDDFINISDADVFDFEGNDFSISLWFKRDGAQNADAGLVNKGIGIDANNGWTAEYANTDTLRFFARNGGSGIVDISGGSVSDNTWTFYTATRSGSTFTLYQDGTQIATGSSGTAIDATDGDVFIGRMNVGSSSSFNGTIDEVMIYKRALAPEEIRTHYLRGSGFGASGAITADKFRVVNTSGSKILEINQSHFSITNTSGDHGLFVVDKVNNQILVPLKNDAAAPTIAFGDGDTGFYESSDDNLRIAVAGVSHWFIGTGSMGGANTGDGQIMDEVASATNPSHTFGGDQDTGLGRAAANQLSLIAGAVEVMRIEKSTATVQSNFSVNDTDGTNRFFIDVSTGNVGIGTTTPEGDLHIFRSSAGGITANANTLLALESSGEMRLEFLSEDSSDGIIAWSDVTAESQGRITYRHAFDDMAFQTKGANAIIIDSSQRVGIGTTAPQYLLQIGSGTDGKSVNLSNVLYVNGSSGNVGIGKTSSNFALDVDGQINATNISLASGGIAAKPTLSFGDGNTGIYESADNSLNIATAGLGRLLINSNGIADISISNGFMLLSVAPTTTAPTIIPNRDDIDTGVSRAGADQLSLIAGATEMLRLDQDNDISFFPTGNVGIGTTNPTDTLTVIGTLNITGNVSLGTNDVLFVDNTSNRVGIGNTAPGSTLPNGFTSASSILLEIRNQVGGANADSGILIRRADSIIGLDLWNEDSGGDSYIDNRYDNDNGDLRFRTKTAGTPVDAMIIIGNGNVGIGTTTPATTLDVQGDANISGTLSVGSFQLGSTSASTMNITGAAITFTGENGSLYQPVYGTDDGLVLYLPFSIDQTNISNTTYDRSPYGNDGTLRGEMNSGELNNGTWTKGKYGNAMSFDGVDDFINTSNNEILNFGASTDFTLEVWINTVSTGTMRVIAKLFNTGEPSPGYLLFISSGTARLSIDDGPTVATQIESTSPINDGAWHHVAGTFDRDGNAHIYIDGVLEDSEDISSFGDISNNHSLLIGRESASAGTFPYNGSLDEVRIYKRALTAEEIRTHYLRGSGFGASGAITADKFRVVNTSGSVQLVLNQSAFSITNTSGDHGLFVVDKVNNQILLPLKSDATFPTIAFGDGDTGFYENIDDQIRITIAGSSQWQITNTILGSSTNQGPYLLRESATLTNPTLLPRGVDTDTGLGADGNNKVSLIAGGKEGIRVEKNRVTVLSNFSVNDTDGTNRLFVDVSNGRVGIGTSSPGSLLEIEGSAATLVIDSATNTDGTIRFFENNGAIWDIVHQSSDDRLSFNSGAGPGYEALSLEFISGKVGINTTTPAQTLQVTGTFNVTAKSGTEPNLFVASDGNVGIGTTTPTMKLQVVGNTNVSQNLFVGGNITTGGADFAEMMYSDEILLAGDVVCFVDALKVKKCALDSDKSVAGVVSSNPTIIGNSIGGDYAIGIVGLVRAKVLGPVDKFELLTTSEEAGYARKATINDFGAILGKTLESCEEERCIVNILVSLS